MCISSGRRMCSTGTANSQANLQQKDLSNGNTKETPDLIPADVGLDSEMEKVLFPCLFILRFPALKYQPSSVWNYISCS